MGNGFRHLREFDRFRIDLEKKVLWHADEPVHLPPKAVELLCELVEKRGQIVTKDELLDRVWHDSFVEESVLSQNIHHLRKAFKDLNVKEDPIQTIPRRGYRFSGEVHEIEDEVVFEHEIIERKLLTEISEDSLRDLGLNKATILSTPTKRHSSLLLALVFSAAAVLIGFAIWQSGPPAEGSALKGIKSIAVLPLKSLNEKEKDQTFSLGLTDSLIAGLGRLNKFTVRPFSAVEKYNESGKDAIGFGQELKADSVLAGTIQRAGDRLRVNLRLIDVRDGAQLWADSFDETESDVLKLQDLISNKVARVLLTRLSPRDEELLAKRPTSSTEAFKLYLAGRERWLRRDWRTDSLAFYQKAIELDPNFALPYLGIADQYAFTYETKIAEDALAKALEIDPNLHEAHATRGFLKMFHHWDWQGAESSFRRALELAPNSSKAHHWYGVYLSLQGRFDEALQEMESALELDPTALAIKTDIAGLYYYKRDYNRAEAELWKVLDIDPMFINARVYMVGVRYKKGASYFRESIELELFRQKQLKADGLASTMNADDVLERRLANYDEATLRQTSLKGALATAKGDPTGYLPLCIQYAIIGEKEKSLDALEKIYESKVFMLPFAAIDPLYDPIRDEARFQEILRKINLNN